MRMSWKVPTASANTKMVLVDAVLEDGSSTTASARPLTARVARRVFERLHEVRAPLRFEAFASGLSVGR
jgi:hypothetical protein